MPFKDLEASRAYQRENWRKYQNPQKKAERVLRRNRENTAWFNQLKATLSCVECGENHPACLDFHHIDPATKVDTLYALIWRGWSRASLIREISKCLVLCANCHRKLHWQEKHKAQNIVDEPSGS